MPPNTYNIFDKLEESHSLSSTGKAWLVRAIDPFHDYELPKVGYPDHCGSNSVVFEVQKSLTISRPSSIVGNWDFHIVQTPLAATVGDVRTGFYISGAGTTADYSATGVLDSASVATMTFGGLIGEAVSSGASTFDSAAFPGDTHSLDASDVLRDASGTSLSTTRCRLVATAFEVENTTAPLHRQGAVTIYNSPSHRGLRNVRPADNVGTAIRSTTTVESFAAPPKSERAARAFMGSRTWHAENGCYVPSRFNDLANPPQEFAGSIWMAVDQDGFGSTQVSFFPGALQVPMVPGTTPANNCGLQYPNIILPLDNAGAYFTGLSAETTLTIILRQTWEIFPSSDASLVRLASPSPPLDTRALEAYSLILRELPMGCVRGDNDGGRWFRDAAKVAAKVLPKAIGYIPMIGDTLGVIKDVIDVGTAGAKAVQQGKQKKAVKKQQQVLRDPGFGEGKGKNRARKA